MKQKPTSNSEAKQTRVRNIYSVIQRKGGRLQELQRKHYITNENGKWLLSRWKGRIALFIKSPDLIGKLEMETYRRSMSLMQRDLKTPSNQEMSLPFGIALSVKGSELKRDVERILMKMKNDPSFISLIVEETKQLITEGINLDLITDESLIALLALRKSVKKKLKRLL